MTQVDTREWPVFPAEIDELASTWREEYATLLTLDIRTTYSGDPVHALTLTDSQSPLERKTRLYISQPHAHEPAPTAAMMNVASELLTGCDLGGRPALLGRDLLSHMLISLLPCGNPDGRRRAPIRVWDGTQYANQQLHCSMRGEDPRNPGQMWERFDRWDRRKIEAPDPVGIVYEQINEHEYVEPNRSHESSFFKTFFKLDSRYHYQVWLDLHQTEFEGSKFNCEVLLPFMQAELPDRIQQHNLALAERINHSWRQAGAKPIPQPNPLGYTGIQREYFRRNWGSLYRRMPILTIEVQNNNPRTPPEMQLALEKIPIYEAINLMLESPREMK